MWSNSTVTSVDRPRASVIIPAHQEEAVIERCLDALLDGAEPDEWDIVVVANGCTDSTSDRVRRYEGRVRLIELEVGSKTGALNAGDSAARSYPRIYADADVALSVDALRSVVDVLDDEGPLIASPRRELQLQNATFATRWYFSAWEALQRARGEIIGTGVYALNEAGRQRFGTFPDLIGDDRYVHSLFRAHERRLVEPPVKVWPAQHMSEVIAVRTRVAVGNLTATPSSPSVDRPSRRAQVHRMLSEPKAVLALPFYTIVTLIIRRRAKGRVRSGDMSWSRAERMPHDA
ncbi:glycosyl transferase family 2 [Blastococcus colisei]|uniref:4,4'-diaponeurosporenoate glycosyltransferase n=1 Tax=Blastococcus colisei TaxID=1564162 RepID=A0A543P1F0_9ACTN|nr:glycosyl transferase family 2 [Blastococcus colisei]